MDDVAETKKKFCKVCLCGKIFTVSASFYRHKKVCTEILNFELENKSNHYICKEKGCTFSSKLLTDFVHHLHAAHKIDCKYECRIFTSYSEFENWKREYENETNTRYLLRSEKKSVKCNIKYFYCNRSGAYQSKSNRKRVLKKQGVSKIGSNCTSNLKVIHKNDDNSVKLYIQHTHYGHKNDLAYIRLSKADRNELANKLSQGFEISQILKHLISQGSGNIQRKHLCTKRDLLNLAKSYGIKNLEKISQSIINEAKNVPSDHVDPGLLKFNSSSDESLVLPDYLENVFLDNSDVGDEIVDYNLFQKTLGWFEKIECDDDDNSLLFVEQQLNSDCFAPESESVTSGEISGIINKIICKPDISAFSCNFEAENHYSNEFDHIDPIFEEGKEFKDVKIGYGVDDFLNDEYSSGFFQEVKELVIH